MEDFHNLDSAINDINSSQESIQEQSSTLALEVSSDSEELESLSGEYFITSSWF